MQELLRKAQDWLATDPDPATRAELSQLITNRDEETLSARFDHPLTFGTAGLRGPIGAGPGAMNLVVVGRAAAGFAAWLKEHGRSEGRIIVGYDARHMSKEFARESAEIFAGAGFDVLLTAAPTPTPAVAFGIRHFECVAGVVVTASHNPPQDNGYKVYLGDGSQIIAPVDQQIMAHISELTPADVQRLPRRENYALVGDELLRAYVARAAQLVRPGQPKRLTWVHSSMHGVGGRWMREVARAGGFPAPHEVAKQAQPDPDFPTVNFPNPEVPGAIDLALAEARRVGADVVIANDPDADRCAVAAVIDGDWRMLTGDELGAILGDDAIRRSAPGVLANSIVSSTLLKHMAAQVGRRHQTTLTGFKWIGRVKNLAFGYEEAIGYCCDPAYVPDKDGLTAALAVLRITAELVAQGRTLQDRLDEITIRHGLHATKQLSVRVKDLSIITDAMQQLRAQPPVTLLGQAVTFRDLQHPDTGLPPTNGVELTGDRVHVVARPSGTEPMLKCYLEVVLNRDESRHPRQARSRAQALLATLEEEMSHSLGLIT